jgi:3-deoxy-manno-octulosonate cytidylyltransferase (CMP-KDO synthetase)
MKVLGIIPARYKSSRFPGKPLVMLNGKPMILHVAEKAALALGADNVVVATDDDRIADVVKQAGYQTIMTADTHPTGTDRLWEVAQKIPAQVYVNLQGDEPLINPQDIIKVANLKTEYPSYVINGMSELAPHEDPANINIPKVLVNSRHDLVYMSRLPIPGIKSAGSDTPVYLKQVCIYAFSYADLKAYGEMGKKAEFEAFEDIEILRFLELGIPVKMVHTQANTLAVDVPEDVERVEQAIKQSLN